jgi:hypothetical protein
VDLLLRISLDGTMQKGEDVAVALHDVARIVRARWGVGDVRRERGVAHPIRDQKGRRVGAWLIGDTGDADDAAPDAASYDVDAPDPNVPADPTSDTLVVTNANGRSFLVRVVAKGDRYGLHDCLLHDKADPLIEFYDLTYKDQKTFGPRGQFVTRYYARTIAAHERGTGLDLMGNEPNWKLDAPALAPVLDLARAIRALSW